MSETQRTVPSFIVNTGITGNSTDLFNDSTSATNTDNTDNTKNDTESSIILSEGTDEIEETEKTEKKSENATLPDISLFLPQWGYSDFMTERLNWQKGLSDIGGEPGWFYFRIFFHFNTAYGLFGGQLNASNGQKITNRTCAQSFFQLWSKHYPTLDMEKRSEALTTFCNMLNNISNNTPWFFQSITGMDKANIQSLNDPFKDNTIEIKCLEESIDIRLSTLFEYYKYACFDYINLKEILPENLRKFDMSVVVFGVPIRYLDTHSKINGKEFRSRTMRGDSSNESNKMTMSMYTFKECEFDIENMTEPLISDMSNQHAFQNNNISIKIKYNKVFNYKQNGFTNSAISTLGNINYTDKNNVSTDVSSRLQKIADAYQIIKTNSSGVQSVDNFVNKFISNKTLFSKWYKFARSQGVGSASKTLIDETEAICQDYYSNTAHSLFNTVVSKGVFGAGELGSITPPDKGINTNYYKETLNNIYNGTIKQSDNINRKVYDMSGLGINTFKVVQDNNTNNYNQTYKSRLIK